MAFKHSDSFNRILNTYPPGPVLLQALVTYAEGVVERAKHEAEQDMAQTVCQGLHDGPAKGLMCRTCYDAEQNAPGIIEMEAQRQIAARIARGE